jgi:hypothetical protein
MPSTFRSNERPLPQYPNGLLLDLISPTLFYPLDNTSWYPRHGYLQRATFQLTFRSKPHEIVAGPGTCSESNGNGEQITHYSEETPIALVTFAGGELRFAERQSAKGVPLQYYSPNDRLQTTTTSYENFVLDELENSLEYFGRLFGRYPYPVLRGVFHPRPFGQGFPTLLLLARTTLPDQYQHAFIAHEVSGGAASWVGGHTAING